MPNDLHQLTANPLQSPTYLITQNDRLPLRITHPTLFKSVSLH